MLRRRIRILWVDRLLSAHGYLIPAERCAFLRGRHQLVISLGVDDSHGDVGGLISLGRVGVKGYASRGQRRAVDGHFARDRRELIAAGAAAPEEAGAKNGEKPGAA